MSFIVCGIVPDLLIIWVGKGKDNAAFQLFTDVAFYVGSTVDAILYINMDSQTRRLVRKKWRLNVRRRSRVHPALAARVTTETVVS